MIIGSLPFLVLAQTSLKNLFAMFKDNQIQVFIFILTFSIIVIYFFANSYLTGNFYEKITSIANTISIISGTGYISEDFENWGNYARCYF